MVLEVQYDELMHQHRELQAKIEAEISSTAPDADVLRRLRWRMALIKDQLESWEHLMQFVRPGHAAVSGSGRVAHPTPSAA